MQSLGVPDGWKGCGLLGAAHGWVTGQWPVSTLHLGVPSPLKKGTCSSRLALMTFIN